MCTDVGELSGLPNVDWADRFPRLIDEYGWWNPGRELRGLSGFGCT